MNYRDLMLPWSRVLEVEVYVEPPPQDVGDNEAASRAFCSAERSTIRLSHSKSESRFSWLATFSC
jgi:hypothetical protein